MKRSMKYKYGLVACQLLLAATASAQTRMPVSYTLTEQATAEAGGSFTLQATFSTMAPWYIYAPTGNNAAQGMTETVVVYRLPEGISREGKMQLPETHFKGGFEVFEGEAITMTQQFKVSSTLKPGTYTIPAKVTYQTCNEKICLPPRTEDKAITLTVTGGGQPPKVQSAIPATEPGSPGQESSDRKPDLLQLNFTALDGRKVDLKSLKGKLVLVDCWASWCRPCIAGFADLKKRYAAYQGKGLEIIGINMDTEAAKARALALIKEHQLPWPQSFEGKGFDDNSLVKAQSIAALPALFLIDHEGHILARDPEPAQLDRLLQQKLN